MCVGEAASGQILRYALRAAEHAVGLHAVWAVGRGLPREGHLSVAEHAAQVTHGHTGADGDGIAHGFRFAPGRVVDGRDSVFVHPFGQPRLLKVRFGDSVGRPQAVAVDDVAFGLLPPRRFVPAERGHIAQLAVFAAGELYALRRVECGRIDFHLGRCALALLARQVVHVGHAVGVGAFPFVGAVDKAAGVELRGDQFVVKVNFIVAIAHGLC